MLLDHSFQNTLSSLILSLWLVANQQFAFITALTVTFDDKPQSYDVSPATCPVTLCIVGWVCFGGFEGTIMFNLVAKRMVSAFIRIDKGTKLAMTVNKFI